jgi:isocitrate dehydrogenase (NAD+)
MEGDGIGPEVTGAAVRVVDCAVDGRIDWERVPAGLAATGRGLPPFPPEAEASLRRTRIGLKGPLTTPVGTGFRSVNVTMRQALDLYACLRPVRSLPGVKKARYQGVDLVLVRENTEGLYSGVEHEVVPGVVEALKIVTRRASLRVARWAFEYARTQGRKKITVVHKATVMPLSDGLFLDCAREVAADYPYLEVETMLLDNLAMELVRDPGRFDVVVLGNLDGDLVSDLCAGLVGGLGVVPGANIGDGHAVFEAVHGSAPDIAGQGRANPIAVTLSAALMLRHIGERRAAARIEHAVDAVLSAGATLTPDLGGRASTTDLCEALLAAVEASP